MPSPDFQLTPSGLEGMDGGMAEGQREREREEEERERGGLSMTPTLKVWVSIVSVSSPRAGVKNSSSSSVVYHKNSKFIWVKPVLAS